MPLSLARCNDPPAPRCLWQPTTQLKKQKAKADDTDCLEHDCPGAGSKAHAESEEQMEQKEESEEEAQIAKQENTMKKFARMSSSIPPSVRAFLNKRKQKDSEALHTGHRPSSPARKSKVELLVAKKQKALLAAKHTLSKIIHPKRANMLSVSSAETTSLSARQRHRIAANIAHIRAMDKIAPLPGLQLSARPVAHAAQQEQHAMRAQEERGVRLLAEKFAARRTAKKQKMLEEAGIKQKQLLHAREKLI